MPWELILSIGTKYGLSGIALVTSGMVTILLMLLRKDVSTIVKVQRIRDDSMQKDIKDIKDNINILISHLLTSKAA